MHRITSILKGRGLKIEHLETCIWAEKELDNTARLVLQVDLPSEEEQYSGWVRLDDVSGETPTEASFWFEVKNGVANIDYFKSNPTGNGRGSKIYTLAESLFAALGVKRAEVEPVHSARRLDVIRFWSERGFTRHDKDPRLMYKTIVA
jgi:hypothetical protein